MPAPKLTQADREAANHLYRQIQAYTVLIDEADSIEQAERFELEQDRLRAELRGIIFPA
jgi:hypothetical protein